MCREIINNNRVFYIYIAPFIPKDSETHDKFKHPHRFIYRKQLLPLLKQITFIKSSKSVTRQGKLLNLNESTEKIFSLSFLCCSVEGVTEEEGVRFWSNLLLLVLILHLLWRLHLKKPDIQNTSGHGPQQPALADAA